MKSLSSLLAGSGGLAVRNWTSWRFAALCALFVSSFSLLTFAQNATIVGTVTDPTGSMVPNATITIISIKTGQSRALKTNELGQYVAPDLAIGDYNIQAQAPGFKIAERKNVILNVGDRARIDFAMQVGAAQETVTVEANEIKVQTDSGEVSNVITGQQVTQLATNGRSLFTLFALAPGAVSLQGDFINPVPVGGDNTVSINGQRAGHNLQLIDGGENLDRGGSSGSVMPSLDALQEFRNMTSNYSAEYGLSSAATITEVVKSGTKQFHASAWEFHRNDALDARNYFNPAPQKVAELRFNTFGFNVGGPADFWKSDHKTFFFYNMEWRRLIQGQILNQTVPVPATYGGNFAANLPADSKASDGVVLHSGLHVPCASKLSSAEQTAFMNAGITTFSQPAPDGSCSVNSKNTVANNPVFQPFPNNAIPGGANGLLNQNAQLLLTAGGKYGGIFPAPNNGAQFIGGNNVPTYLREEIARVDHTFNSKFSVFGHWISEQISQGYGTSQWSGDNVPSVGDTFGNPSYSAVVHATHVISPTLLNEISFNYNGNRINIIPNGLISAPSGFTFNRLFTGPNVDQRIPSINLAGSTGSNYTVNWMPWVNKADDYQVRDDLSWTRGAHQLKFGFSWAIYKKVQDWFATTQGNFTFNGSFTGNDFADYLLGFGQQYTENAVKHSGNWNNISPAAYIQDNWRVNNRLTLNLGLRWDGIPHTYEANNKTANFYPNLYDTSKKATFDNAGHICSGPTDPGCTAASPGLGTSPDPVLAGLQFYTNGMGIGGVGGIPKNLVDNSWAKFGPRVGFAYDLTGRGQTVIRGGFGIMYERIQGNDMYNTANNTPFNASPTLNNVSLSDPGTSVSQNIPRITAAALPILAVGQTGIAKDYPSPTSYQYSVGVQRSLNTRTVLSVSYVGSQSRNENFYQEINLPDIASLPALVAAGGSGINQKYNYLGYGAIRLAHNQGQGHYNSLQVDLHGSVYRDLQLQFGYTYAKAHDSTTGTGSGGDLNNATNPYVGWKYDDGPSIYDRTNVAFVNFVYDIPLLKHSDNRFMRTVVGGWSLSGIVTMESGAPLNMGVSGSNASSVVPNSGNRPDLVGTIHYPKTVNEWFDPSAFAKPACTTGPDCYGTLGHDAVRGPGRNNWNLSLFKSFVISESRGSRFEFRAESFNTWNHTQFKGDYNTGGISTNVGSSNFGHVTGAFDPREFQLGAKLIF
jgi:carboxypeptidase family protein